MLVVKLQIGFGDGVGVEHAVAAVILPVLPFRGDAAIDHEMADMDVLWVQFARQRLGKTA